MQWHMNICRLCGYEPFIDDDERVMYKKILKGSYEFDSPYWDNITHNAKVWERVNVQDNSERIV